uniref:Uncharacterized protein n=1 Tax=Timema shepardi TaxID=629360 RepID=A0A7R9G5S5_TIMSH|nr:unnamed protein product [Timema shepardi]
MFLGAGKETVVQGSLGGLQVLDLTPEGQRHQRILSLGKDPLIDRSSLDLVHTDLYTMGHSSGHLEERRAFSFGIKRSPGAGGPDCAEIKLRMASVWYTHSSQFIKEVQSCATEFKQYLSNLARSIKTAAAEMALGLVHMRTEVLAQGLYKNTRLATSFGSGSLWEMSPRRRRKSWSLSYEQLEGMSGGTRATTPHSPHSPSVDEDFLDLIMDIRMDIVLDTPVVVLPRGPCSPQVLVAHLGKITISNSRDDEDHANNWGVVVRRERYIIEIRDMNLYSLDTDLRVNSCLPLVPMRAEKLYSCTKDGKPILHDTMIHLVLDRNVVCQSDSVPSLLLGEDAELHKTEQHDVLHISGSVVTPLKVSLSRQQYEQLLDSVDNLLSGPSPSPMTR